MDIITLFSGKVILIDCETRKKVVDHEFNSVMEALEYIRKTMKL